jgi:hypothetical protein
MRKISKRALENFCCSLEHFDYSGRIDLDCIHPRAKTLGGGAVCCARDWWRSAAPVSVGSATVVAIPPLPLQEKETTAESLTSKSVVPAGSQYDLCS